MSAEDPNCTREFKDYVEPADLVPLDPEWDNRHPAIPGTREQWQRIGAAARRLDDPMNDSYIIDNR